MTTIHPFSAWRPVPELVHVVAALPYDVMNSEEARQMVVGNPHSFLHVDKAEIDLSPEIDPYDELVYHKARENLNNMKQSGVLIREAFPELYIYQETWQGHTQTGLVTCVSVQEYLDGAIKKHELTRFDKEQDRVQHVKTCAAHTGPIFLTYRAEEAIRLLLQNEMKNAPIYDFISENDVQHVVWRISQPQVIQELIQRFQAVPALYIADGHHRAASAARVAQEERMKKGDQAGNEEYEYFLAVLFPEDELTILPYYRVVKDLNGLNEMEFLAAVRKNFIIEEAPGNQAFAPQKPHSFGMYLSGKWYQLTACSDIINPNDPVASLDVSLLQNHLLNPVLGIGDPRIDKRIDFIGGIRGLSALEARVQEDMRVAFSLYPTQISDLMQVADRGEIMPPKSTWFEPKLLSGIFIHDLF